jgi:hypothetical protein
MGEGSSVVRDGWRSAAAEAFVVCSRCVHRRHVPTAFVLLQRLALSYLRWSATVGKQERGRSQRTPEKEALHPAA